MPVVPSFYSSFLRMCHTSTCFKKDSVHDFGLGAVLTQEFDQRESVITYAARLLHDAVKAYSMDEKECSAIVWTVKKKVGDIFEIMSF